VAVGSIDGEAAKAMSALASELVSTNEPVRLKVISTAAHRLRLLGFPDDPLLGVRATILLRIDWLSGLTGALLW